MNRRIPVHAQPVVCKCAQGHPCFWCHGVSSDIWTQNDPGEGGYAARRKRRKLDEANAKKEAEARELERGETLGDDEGSTEEREEEDEEEVGSSLVHTIDLLYNHDRTATSIFPSENFVL